MLQKDQFKSLVESCLQESGNDTFKANRLAGDRVDDLIQEGKINPDQVSLKALFEGTVDLESQGIDKDDAVRVAEGINKSAFPTISTKLINKKIIDAYNLTEGEVAKLYSTIEATRTDEENIVGFTNGDYEPQLRPEGLAYEETSFGEKDWSIKMADFGRMISLTRETIFEDRTGSVMNKAKNIGEAAGQHKAKMVIQTLGVDLRTAFNEATSKAAVYKGTALAQATFYSDDHSSTIDSAGTNDNKSTIAINSAATAITAVKSAWLQLQKMVDEAGNKITVGGPYFLVVPPDIYVDVWNAFNTPSWNTGDTVNTPTGSPLGSMSPISVIQNPFVAANEWFFGRPDQQLNWVEVFAPATASQGTNAELAFTNQIVARYRFNYHGGAGMTDYRYVIGKV